MQTEHVCKQNEASGIGASARRGAFSLETPMTREIESEVKPMGFHLDL